MRGDEPGAEEGTRTPDLLITNQLLYRLSYLGSGDAAARGVSLEIGGNS